MHSYVHAIPCVFECMYSWAKAPVVFIYFLLNIQDSFSSVFLAEKYFVIHCLVPRK